MAKVPDDTALGNRPTPNPNSSVATIAAPPVITDADGLYQAGGNVMRLAELVDREQDRLDTTRAEDAWNKYKNSALDLSVGQDGFAQKKSGDAINGDLLKDYGGRLKDSRNMIESELNERQREKFNARANVTDLQFRENVLRHYAEQRGAYEKSTFESAIATAGAMVAAAPWDQAVFNTALVNLDRRAEAAAQYFGTTDPNAMAAFKAKIRDDLYAKRINALLYRDPIQAENLLRLVSDQITNPELRLTLQSRTREAGLIVRASTDADALIREVRADVPAGGTKNSPATGPELIRQNIAFLESQPGADDPNVRRAIAEQRALLGNEASAPNTSGLPNSRDIRAQLPVVLARVEAKATSIYGPDPTNPDRVAYVNKLTNEVKSKIQLEVVQLEAIQKEAQGKLIDAIAGFGGGGRMTTLVGQPQQGPQLLTSFSQIQANPDLMRSWQMLDPAAKLGLERLMEHNLRADQKGNDPLYWEVWNRIHLEPGDKKKIDFYQQILEFAGPGKLNTQQIGLLRQEIDRAETPGGRSINQLMRGAAARTEQYFKTHIMFTAQPDRQIAAVMRWTEDAGKKIDEYVKAKKDTRTLFQMDTPDSIVNPKVLDTYVNTTPAQGLAQGAGQVRAGEQPPVVQPPLESMTKLDAKDPNKSYEALAQGAWFIAPDGRVGQKGRATPAAAPGGATPEGPIPSSRVLYPQQAPEPAATAPAAAAAAQAAPESLEDEIVDVMPKAERTARTDPRREAGVLNLTDEQIKRQDAITAKIVGVLKGLDPIDAAAGITGPAGRFIARKLGEVLGRRFNTVDESFVATYRELAKNRKWTLEMQDVVRGALDSGQLTPEEAARAKRVLAKMAEKAGEQP